MDTDSIVTNMQLPEHLIGNKLGQFKLEHKIKKAYFISSKTYCLMLDDGRIIIKAKGVDSSSLCLDDFVNMYLYQKNTKAMKNYAERSYEEGFVNIKNNKTTILNFDAYKKRDKIFNSEGIWVDTKPLEYTIMNDKNILRSMVTSKDKKALIIYTKQNNLNLVTIEKPVTRWNK